MARGRNTEEKEPVIRLNNQQKQLIALVVGCIMLATAAFILIAQPASTGALAQAGQCTNLQPEAKYLCLLTIANQTKNLTYCSYMSGSQEQQCVAAVTSAPKSKVSCSELNSNSGLYVSCVMGEAMQSLNASVCGSLSGVNAYNCVMNVSVASKFASVGDCQYIHNTTYSALCLTAYSFSSAVSSENLAYCSGLSNQTNSSLTLAMSTALGGVSTNAGALTFLSPRDYCYNAMASATDNALVCTYMSQTYSSECYSELANTTLKQQPTYQYNFNVSTPEQACTGGPLNSSSCYMAYYIAEALRDKNYTACSNLQGDSLESCIYTYAYAEENTSYCQYISSNILKTACYSSVSTALNSSKVGYEFTTTVPVTYTMQTTTSISNATTTTTNSTT